MAKRDWYGRMAASRHRWSQTVNRLFPLLVATLVVALPACQKQAEEPAADPRLTGPVPEGMVRGTVVETMDSGGYTYAALDINGEIRWIAGPPSILKPGDVALTSAEPL